MGDGVSFFKGMDDCSVSYGSTQPEKPSMGMGGPIEGYKGSDDGHSFGTTNPNKSAPGGDIIVSPTDK